MFYLATWGLSCHRWDLLVVQHVGSINSSLTRDGTWPFALGVWSFRHWTTRDVPTLTFLKSPFWWFQSLMSGHICQMLKWHENTSWWNSIRGLLHRRHFPVRCIYPRCLGKRGYRGKCWAMRQESYRDTHRLTDNSSKYRSNYDKAGIAQISRWEEIIERRWWKGDLEAKYLQNAKFFDHLEVYRTWKNEKAPRFQVK